MSVLVYIDTSKGLNKAGFEAVYYGKKVADQAGTDVQVVTFGGNAELDQLGKYGASKVHVAKSIDTPDPQIITKLVNHAADASGATIIVFSHDTTGKAIAPRLSAKMGAGLVAGAVDLPDTSEGFVVKVNSFSGKAFSFVEVLTEQKILSLLPNSLMPEEGEGTAEVAEISEDFGQPAITIKETISEGGDLPLPEAELVVSAGRGLKGPENWKIVENLADALGAATACSRPVADMEWRPHHEHVGQTGVAIRPNLYIAAGISGAIQHLAGVNGSKVIVVINTDEEAPFFKAADYGIVGDAFEVLPKLVDAVKNFKAANN